MGEAKRFLFLEPFYGGSHKDFADGLVEASRHDIALFTLPARFWKWRMRGAALHFFDTIESFSSYDGLIVTDLMSLADLKALGGAYLPPAVVYFHENQLTYPSAPDEPMDYQFGFTNLTTALSAEKVIFNSHTHYHSFFSALPGFLNMMPEYKSKWTISAVKDKSEVIYPGCHFLKKQNGIKRASGETPLIIWNHRWEFDKNSEDFFYALGQVMNQGIDFRIALLGENFQAMPKEFVAAKETFGKRIAVYGYVESKTDYAKWISEGDIVVSTAIQENFGISIVEAVRAGCTPLVPNRLSYPEIIPEAYHEDFLFTDRDDLVDKLVGLLSGASPVIREKASRLSRHMDAFAWEKMIAAYDEMLDSLSSLSRNR